MKIQMYKSSTDTIGAEVSYKKVLQGIKEGRWNDEVVNLDALRERVGDDYSNAKKALPSVTFSGTFSKRGIDFLVNYSQLIVIDIDKISKEQIAEYSEAFKGDGFINAFFVSPSGLGLKVVIKLNCGQEHHLSAFLSLEKYFLDNYAIAIDKSGKDVSRLCYVSSDPDLYFNEESEPYTFDIAEAEASINTKRGFDDRPDRFKGYVPSKDAKYAYKVCEVWAQRHHQYEQGNRNNYIHVLACNMNRVGVDMEDATLMVYNNYSDISFKEIEATIKSGYKNASEHNTVNVYDIEKGIIPDDEPPMELTAHEDMIFQDALEFFRKDVKKGKIAKLLKCFGANHLGFSEEKTIKLMEMAHKKIEEDNTKNTLDSESATESLLKAVADYKDNGGVSTGVPEFDDVLGGGLMPGNLYGAIGDGGTYKSVLAQCIGTKNAKSKESITLYLSGEMSVLQMMDRVVNEQLGIELVQGLKSKTLGKEQVDKITADLFEIIGDSFQIVHSSGWTQASIVKTVSNIEKKFNKKVSLILCDGLSQMEDTKKNEIHSAIFNSGELKQVAKETSAAVLVLVHISGGMPKHVRDTSKFIRGGTKLINNMDAMLCTSLFIDEDSSNMETGDLLYRQGIFYLRLIDKRGSGLVMNKAIQVHRPLRLEPLTIEPSVMEVSVK